MNQSQPKVHAECATLFAEVREQFTAAEQYIKHVVTAIGDENGVSVPAINELRYAGQHLFAALFTDDRENQCKQLRKSLNHCHRASYDAVEAGCMKLIELIDEFYREYEDCILTDDIADYSTHKTKVREIRDFIVSHSRDNAHEYWESLKAHFDILKEIQIHFDEARPEINKRKSKDRNSHLMTLGGWIIGAFGIITTIASIFW